MDIFKPTLISMALAAAGLISSPTVVAAEDAASPDDEGIEIISVTTERRVKSLQKTAATVQSLGAMDLNVMGVQSDFKDLQHAIGGLQVGEQEGKIEVYLRGIGSSDSDFASDPSVATHYNGVYLPRPRSIGPMFFDVQRVEVNKGPQGTLRGRNATGGSINIISNKPNTDETYAEVTLGVGNFNLRKAEMVGNLSVTNDFAVRLAVHKEEHDSFYTNAYRNGDFPEISVPHTEDSSFTAPGDKDDTAIRVSALWEPSDQLEVYVIADHVKQQGSGFPGAFTGFALGEGYDIDDLDDPYNQYFLDSGEVDNTISGLAVNVSYDFGRVGVEYSGSYRTYDFYNMNAPREWRVGMVYPGSEVDAAQQLTQVQRSWGRFTQAEESTTTTHEVRLYNTDQGALEWTAGVFRLDEDFDSVWREMHHGWFGDCDWFVDGTHCGWLNGDLGSEKRNEGSKVESTALYADGTYSLTDNFRLKAGIRWSEDTKEANQWWVEHRIVVSDEALIAEGLVDANGAADSGQIIMGSSGIEITAAGDRAITDIPIVYAPAGQSQDDLMRSELFNGSAGQQQRVDFFLDGIQRWGANDNLDDLIANQPNGVDVLLTSPYGGSGKQTRKYEDDYINWRLGFEYDLDAKHMAYGTISTGTRVGGFNEIRTLSNGEQLPGEWDPAELMVYEVGSKLTGSVGGLPYRLNTALFYYDYEDMIAQDMVAVPTGIDANNDGEIDTSNYVYAYNLPEATLYGVEVDGELELPALLSLTWNYSYLDSEIGHNSQLDSRGQGPVYDDGGNQVGTSDILGVDLEGNRLANTSKHNLNMALSQLVEIDNGMLNTLDWSVSMAYRSEFFLTNYNNRGFSLDRNGEVIEVPIEQMNPVDSSWAHTATPDGRFGSDKVDGYLIFNANIGINMGTDDQFRVELWGSNLTDETYSSKGFINRDVNIRFLNSPRMYGVNFKARF